MITAEISPWKNMFVVFTTHYFGVTHISPRFIDFMSAYRYACRQMAFRRMK